MIRKLLQSNYLTRVSLAALLSSAAFSAWQAPALAQTCSCPSAVGGVVIRADEPPPPLPIYDQPPMPASGYIWTPGYWAWNNYDYYWVPGTWVEPPRPGLLWTPGYWGFVDGIYAFHRGYWGERVGFYGGVAYGFGYTGNGYDGGRWDDGHFFYNRVVNNFGDVHVTNVYEKTIVNNQVNSRVSFNGGNGGIQARPTPAEEAAAREQHVQPTQTQVNHARTASMDGALFQSNNHGKPTIAATTHATAFSGAGVTHGKESGSTPAAIPQVVKPVARPEHLPEGAAPSHALEAQPRSRSGVAPTHEPQRNAAPAHNESEHVNPQNPRRPEHNGAPVMNEPHQGSSRPRPEQMRHGPGTEERPAAVPHVEAPRMERPATARPEAHGARPAPRPEPHATPRPEPHATARPKAQHPAAPHRPESHRPEEH